MRKTLIILTTGLVALAISTAQAQTDNVNETESTIGIKGGMNLSSLTIDDDTDQNLKFGFHVGVFNKIPFSERFAIQPELLYSVKGLKYSYNNTSGVDGESDFNLHYLDMPVQLVFNLTDDFAFQFGPYVSYLVYAHVDTDATILDNFDVDEDEEIDRDNFHQFDYGLTAGMTFDLDPLLVGLNYNWGLNAVAKDGESAEKILGDAHNQVIQVFVGLKF